MIDIPTLSFVITSAALDAINPFAIEVLLFIVAMWLGRRQKAGRILLLGGTYILAMGLTYFLAGLGLLNIFALLPITTLQIILLIIGVVVIGAGMLEVKEFFWREQGPWLRFPTLFARRIQTLANHASKVYGVALLGVYLALVELVCTGAPYLATISALKVNFDASAIWLLILYNLIFIAPLILIVIMAAAGTKISAVQRWTDESKDILRLGSGFLLILLGWIIMLIANGVINFG